MILAAAAETCEPCQEAQRKPLGYSGRFDFTCMSCVGRNLAADPRIDSQRRKAAIWKDRLLASDFGAAMKAREAWLEHERTP